MLFPIVCVSKGCLRLKFIDFFSLQTKPRQRTNRNGQLGLRVIRLAVATPLRIMSLAGRTLPGNSRMYWERESPEIRSDQTVSQSLKYSKIQSRKCPPRTRWGPCWTSWWGPVEMVSISSSLFVLSTLLSLLPRIERDEINYELPRTYNQDFL